jgi:hypothetical protein
MIIFLRRGFQAPLISNDPSVNGIRFEPRYKNEW